MKISNVFDFYDHYVGSYLKDRKRVDRSKNEVHMVNFLVYLHQKIGLQHIGYEWFNQYMIYQLDYWRSKDVKYETNMSFTKIIAKASLDRYLNKSKDFNWWMARNNLKIPKLDSPSIDYDRFDLRKVHQGLTGCLSNNLKHNDSHTCRLCSDSVICKKL